MSDDFGLILDILVVALLGATIFYAATLSSRLSQLRGDRRELESVVRGLAEAAAKADTGVKGLRATAEEAGGELQKQIDQVQTIRDELAFLVDTGEKLADRLEQSANQAQRRQAAPAACQPAVPANRGKPRSQPEARPAPAAEPQAEPARRVASGGGNRAVDRSLIHAIENLR